MSTLEFAELTTDVENNGFAQNVIYLYEGKVLDGWHRYQVAVNLNKVDELEFKDVGDIENPLSFAMGINYFRRHMSASHRAVVKALAHQSEWFQLGDNQHTEGMQHCTPTKSSAEMAAEVQVSKRLMDDAKKVVQLGLADEVVRHGKSINQVLKQINRVRLCHIEPGTFECYEINRRIPVSQIRKILHTLFCTGNFAKHIFFEEDADGKRKVIRCEQCFKEGNTDGAGCDAIGTHLDLVKDILTDLENDTETVKELAENPELLKQLRDIAVESSILTTDAERVLAKISQPRRGNP